MTTLLSVTSWGIPKPQYEIRAPEARYEIRGGSKPQYKDLF